MVHTILISGHTAAGLIALVAGCLALRRDRAIPVYLASVVALAALLVAAVAAGWPSQTTPTRVTFTALTLLAVYVLWRAVRATLTRRPGPTRQSPQFLDHLGFTLVALLVGFAVIASRDLGAPIWLAVLVAAGCIVLGHLSLRRMKARESQRPADQSSDLPQHTFSHTRGNR